MEESSSAAVAAPFDRDRMPTPALKVVPRSPGNPPPNFVEEIARQRLGQPPEWRVCVWERVGRMNHYDGCVVAGGVPRILTRGKRKGQQSWSHLKRRDLLKVAVSPEDEARAHADYEAATGACHECGGSGAEWAGWSSDAGNRYRICSRCLGTGNAPTAMAREATPVGEANLNPTLSKAGA
jgi:hypothetical protein